MTAPPRASARDDRRGFRLTVEDHPGPRRGPHQGRRGHAWTWSELRERVDALAGGLPRSACGAGDTVALMLGNRPEFHVADLAVMTLGATPFSIYLTFTPEQIAYVVADAGARSRSSRSRSSSASARRADLPALEHVVVLEGAAARDDRLGRRRGRRPGFDAEPHWRADRARRPADADLHVGHHRPAEGRPAHAPQPDGRGRDDRRR